MTPVFGLPVADARPPRRRPHFTSLSHASILSTCTYYILERLIDLKRSMVCIVLKSPIAPALSNEIPSCESQKGWSSALNGVFLSALFALFVMSHCAVVFFSHLSLVVSESAGLLFQSPVSLSKSRRVPVCRYSVLGRSRLLSLSAPLFSVAVCVGACYR
jgi:hypothetical protein